MALTSPLALADRLEQAVRAGPDGSAVEDDRTCLSYGEFYNVAHGLALELAALPPGSLLLSMDRSVEGVVAYWAAFLAGRRLTPVSPSWPADRRTALARAVGAHHTLVASTPAGAAAEIDVSLALDRLRGQRPRTTARHRADDGADAYVLFTSGSTGRPKGVRISRAALTAYVDAATGSAGLGPGDRASHNIDYTFDPSIYDVFVTLGSGATLCVPQRGEQLRPVAFVTRARLTHWCSVPSLIGLADRLGSLAPDAMPTLRRSMFLGEALLRSDAQRWRQAAPRSVLVNAYGPTELTNTCFEYRWELGAELPETGNGTVPIGHANPGQDWGLLDAAGSSSGELVVRGVQRLTSYLDTEDNTGRFARRVPLDGSADSGWRPADVVAEAGESATVDAGLAYRTGDLVEVTEQGLVHLGRTDRQVKLRGQRVEPAEVEHLLRQLLGLERVTVFPERQGAQARLVAVVEAASPAGSTRETDGQEAYRRADPWQEAPPAGELRGRMPAHLIPARWVALSRFPVNARGKLDLDAIRRMAAVESR